ncbi:MAG: PEP-CTERM sorting domain-containing protein [Planctomycetes bacterium]|nr:PEP-CTERM sorting domain-containing protein [Planctomycetota bacterium]
MRSLSVFSAACLCAFLVSPGAQATTITIDLDIEISGATPPAGPLPWMTVTFDDGDTPGSVDVTVGATNLSHPEFAFNFLFNLDPGLDLSDLVFSGLVKTGTFEDPIVSTGLDFFQADGDGYFDIEIMFNAMDGASEKFSDGETVTYTITNPGAPVGDEITASSFDFLSTPDGSPGTFPVAAHIGGIGPNDESGWIAPEPTALSLLALGGLLAARRRR